ncbi:hypothetical protein BJ508DRAFT_305814 [Ascobolus immersus RN42]|uniref:Uncharacterized protein n=1 Tax=Ascobolus immersus RN42 TaxID=1160509 RepID=A0A3N4IKK2_ASCIM|nr:hypothetical protein BJ508DRAFT_305814 [Ascobolus immersus RN42]
MSRPDSPPTLYPVWRHYYDTYKNSYGLPELSPEADYVPAPSRPWWSLVDSRRYEDGERRREAVAARRMRRMLIEGGLGSIVDQVERQHLKDQLEREGWHQRREQRQDQGDCLPSFTLDGNEWVESCAPSPESSNVWAHIGNLLKNIVLGVVFPIYAPPSTYSDRPYEVDPRLSHPDYPGMTLTYPIDRRPILIRPSMVVPPQCPQDENGDYIFTIPRL